MPPMATTELVVASAVEAAVLVTVVVAVLAIVFVTVLVTVAELTSADCVVELEPDVGPLMVVSVAVFDCAGVLEETDRG
jgi:hypothetical protein